MPTINEIVDLIIKWTKLKCRLEKTEEKTVYFKEREIWWAHLGQNAGSEQHGKNEQFDRPVLIVKKFNARTLLVLPSTTVDKEGGYYFKSRHEPEQRGQTFILSQLRTVSAKRLIKKQRTLPKDEFEAVRQRLKDLL